MLAERHYTMLHKFISAFFRSKVGGYRIYIYIYREREREMGIYVYMCVCGYGRILKSTSSVCKESIDLHSGMGKNTVCI